MAEQAKFKPKKEFLDEEGNVAANYYETSVYFEDTEETVSGKYLTIYKANGEGLSLERSLMEKLYLFIQDIVIEDGFATTEESK